MVIKAVLFLIFVTILCCQELQQKREQRRQRENEIADQEIAFLKASGKVSAKPAKVQRTKAMNKSQSRNTATKPNSNEVEGSPVNTESVSMMHLLFIVVKVKVKPRYLV